MPAVGWAWSARSDLEAIEAFLDDIDPFLARDMVDRIIAASERLLLYHEIGSPLDNGMRALSVSGTPYRIVYRLIGTRPEIARIRHARENWRI